jgi:hypothetical protein
MTSTTSTSPTVNPAQSTLAERMEPTARAGAAAHSAVLGQAIDRVRWERRGILGRLRRTER